MSDEEHWASIASHAECYIGARVRSKRRSENLHGTISKLDDQYMVSFKNCIVLKPGANATTHYPILVKWDNRDEEWCREGELREPK